MCAGELVELGRPRPGASPICSSILKLYRYVAAVLRVLVDQQQRPLSVRTVDRKSMAFKSDFFSLAVLSGERVVVDDIAT